MLDDSGRCHRCGLVYRLIVTAGTMRLAIAIAEVLKGKRRIGDSKHRKS